MPPCATSRSLTTTWLPYSGAKYLQPPCCKRDMWLWEEAPCLYLHNECAEAVAPHCGEHVQLHAAHRGLNRCHHLRIGSVQFGKGNSHSLGIPGSVHRDTKQVTQGFRERRESRIKQPFHRHSTPARTRLRDSGVINR